MHIPNIPPLERIVKMTTIHIDVKTHAILKRLKKEKRKKDMDDVINMLLAEHEILSQKPPIEAKDKPVEDETLKCVNRIFANGFYWCVVKPPKAIRLLSLDVCRVCKARKLGLSDSTKIEEKVKEAQNHAWLKDPNRGKDKGMIWCKDGGLLVFPSKCDTCLQFDCEHHPLKKRMEKERELYGQ
jgi:hypothetical protein